MRRIVSRVLFGILAVVLSVSGYVTYFTYENEKTTIAKVDETVSVTGVSDDVRVEIYSRVWHEKEDNPVFAIGELINKCINYKIAYPDDDVEIDCAMYRIDVTTACYYIPGTRNYGKVTSLSSCDYTDDCERIAYSFIKAAKYGITVNLIYHREQKLSEAKVLEYFMSYMDEECYHDATKTVADYLTVRKSEWPLENLSSNQMHNKQLLISDYLDWDGTVYHNSVYTSTSNIDAYSSSTNLPTSSKDWTHTAFNISNHEKLYLANLKYFNLTFTYYKDRFEFVDAVLAEHAKGDFEDGGLNYKDEYFECYFTPLPQTYTDMYDFDYNPYAYYFDKLKSTDGVIKCYMNMYHTGADAMVERLFETLVEAFTNNTYEGSEFGYKQAMGLTTEDYSYALLTEITSNIDLEKMTHGKDTMLYFGDDDTYVTITGSANLHYGEFASKSNTIMVFKESGDNHPIYDQYLQAYNDTTRNKGYGIGSNL